MNRAELLVRIINQQRSRFFGIIYRPRPRLGNNFNNRITRYAIEVYGRRKWGYDNVVRGEPHLPTNETSPIRVIVKRIY